LFIVHAPPVGRFSMHARPSQNAFASQSSVFVQLVRHAIDLPAMHVMSWYSPQSGPFIPSHAASESIVIDPQILLGMQSGTVSVP